MTALVEAFSTKLLFPLSREAMKTNGVFLWQLQCSSRLSDIQWGLKTLGNNYLYFVYTKKHEIEMHQ